MKAMQHRLTASVLEQIHNDYQALLKSGTKFSIASLLNFHDFKIQEYCQSYKPHAEADQLIKVVKAFSEEYGIWLPNAKHHITCALFLFPNATFERQLTIMENLTVDFYLNDLMGRDVFKYLSSPEQADAARLISRMGSVDERLLTATDADRVEIANMAILQTFRDHATADWFKRFVNLYSYHIGVTHKDCNAATLGHIPSEAEYISLRCHYGGMHHTVCWAEYSSGDFLDWSWLETAGLLKEMERLHTAITTMGALSNDLFSFEKEVIDHRTDANLLMVIALNHPEKPLTDVIQTAANIVRDFLMTSVTTLNCIRGRCQYISASARLDTLQRHLADLELMIQACWMWQAYTKRYKHTASVFLETVMGDEKETAH
jgi:Terpene synthase family 2, C-terminal metal binding